MIELKDAQRQLERMIGLKFGPRAAQARTEVLKVLRDSGTVDIAESVVTQWLDARSEFPTPAELRVLLTPLNASWMEARQKRLSACVICEGTGWEPMRGVNSFDGNVVTGVRPCECRRTGIPITREDWGCKRCQGHGIYGGAIGGEFRGPWKWCDCATGRARQVREPGIVREANVAREKLMRPKAPRGGGLRPIAAIAAITEDPYHGEY